MRTFNEQIKQHLILWANDGNIDPEMLERETGRPWVLKPQYKKHNLYEQDWWHFIEGQEHRWARALNSSQCFAVNLFAPLAVDSELAKRIWPSFPPNHSLEDRDSISIVFEYSPDGGPEWLGERPQQPTQVDVAFIIKRESQIIGQLLIEVKFTENEFGSCRGASPTKGKKEGNPDPSRCLNLQAIMENPAKQCWMVENEGRKYWEVMCRHNSSFTFASHPHTEPCPFRHSLYQLMRNRVLADAITANTEAMWTDVAVFLHPDNDSVRVLPEAVDGHTDAVTAINHLLPNNPINVIDPLTLLELVTTHDNKWNNWATVMRRKYKL